MMARIPRRLSSDQVHTALQTARPDGLTLSQLVAATGLTPGQVRNGLLGIKLELASEHRTPLTYDPKHGYRYSDYPADWVDYERSRMQAANTIFERMVKGTLDPHIARLPDDSFPRMVDAQLTAMLSALQFVLAQPYESSEIANAGDRPSRSGL